MNKLIIILVAGIISSAFSDACAMFQAKQAATEEALFESIEMIVTASKREQRIQDSPATISVITEEDIKESGAMSIPDILRFIPGLDVMEITASHWEVNARGLNQLRSNKMLVMIDNRTVYLDYFGGVIWQSLPVMIEDIKRIEIIRSPISALYGANAFSGIINIITKSPNESEGTLIGGQGGNLNNYRTTFIHGGRNGKFGYKVSGNFRNIDSWLDNNPDSDENSEQRGVLNTKIDYIIDGKSSISFDAGFETGTIDQIILSKIQEFDGTTGYIKSNYTNANTTLQFFWNHGDIKAPPFFDQGASTDIMYNTFDGEIVHNLDVGNKTTLTIGASARINTIESTIIDKEHSQNLFAGFLQGEFRFTDRVRSVLGFRVDDHPLVNTNFSPRASIIAEPVENHTFRFTAGRAFRDPTFTDSYLLLAIPPTPLPSPPFPPGAAVNGAIVGNVNLNPEEIQTYEIGYQTFIKRKTKLKFDLFYNRIDDFIGTGDFVPTSFFRDPNTGDLIIDPITNLPVPSRIEQTNINLGNAEAFGGEFEADILVNDILRLRGNYSYQHMQNRYTLHRFQEPPQNKFNIMSDFSFDNGLSFSLLGRFVGEAKWDIDTTNDSVPEKHVTDSYFTLDSRISIQFPDYNFDATLIFQNIFEKIHKEYPIGEDVGRRIGLRLNVRF